MNGQITNGEERAKQTKTTGANENHGPKQHITTTNIGGDVEHVLLSLGGRHPLEVGSSNPEHVC